MAATFQPFTPGPARQIPGAFLNTPAVTRNDTVRRRLNFGEPPTPAQPQSGQGGEPRRQQQLQPQHQDAPLPPVLKAAQAINGFLQQDESFPDLDSYCRPGASSDYDEHTVETTWAPFYKKEMHTIPEEILNRLNGGEVNTKLGLFAEINHAWASIDSSLFLWDYTHPNPEVIGYEEATQNITAVAMVTPRRGVFINTITHLLVVATGSELTLLGVSATSTPVGSKQIQLYQTKMACHKGGPDVSIIAGSATGRIFFGGASDTDVYELYYQQEEKWFSNRVGKINHSNPGFSLVPRPSFSEFFHTRTPEHLVDIKIDDSRNLLYTLSSKSTIRTYHLEAPDKLSKVIEKQRNDCLRDVAHMIDISPLLNERTNIVALSPISAQEATKLHVMALTNTGCRLFLSATSSASYMSGSSSGLAPQSMQVQFVKFPPRERPGGNRREDVGTDISSRSLTSSSFGQRFPPGYFLDFVQKETHPGKDLLFISTPDSGKIKKTTPASALKFYEHCNWIDLGEGSRAIAVGLASAPFAAAKQPLGFGNELAVQFDQPPTEIAVLTNSGVHIIRRRRLVDIFAATIRNAAGDEGVERTTRDFIYMYGRVETISAALAVACGQGSDLRLGTSRAMDHATEDRARTAFVEFGGQPTVIESDGGRIGSDSIKLSARHEALASYLTRLLRALWKTRVVTLGTEPSGGVAVTSTVPAAKLTSVQENVERLRAFLETNKSFIQGLSGPSDAQRLGNRQAEVAVQAEHQAISALLGLMASVIEGISFVQMLFDERVADIFMRLDDAARAGLRDLTYENLFSQPSGKELAKLLVKAIVNRNIKNGSNVETVADALRRRCGSFCSPDDVVIFKAQEQLQRATEQANNPNALRQTLSDSLLLFERVAGSLTSANLRSAVDQYVELKYYAGAIRLCLTVAREKDRGNRALAWYNDGQPPNDSRKHFFDERKRCYDLIHDVLTRLDAVTGAEPQMIDGRPTLAATKRAEAYQVVNESDDEVFHFNLYEWYIEQNWTDRILAIDSPHVVTYLQRLAALDIHHAELLCRFYTHRSRFFEAAQIQFDLAQSDFAIGIKERITLLSRAKANASVSTIGIDREDQQRLNHNITELLDVAHIQHDLLERLRSDNRIPPEKMEIVGPALDGAIQTLSELFNEYADQAGYYDLCLLIFHAADFHNPRFICETWESLINSEHLEAERKLLEWEQGQGPSQHEPAQPYEVVSTRIMNIAHRTSLDSLIFPIDALLPIVCNYAVSNGQDASIGADPCWPVLLFLQLGVSHAMVVRVLERIFDSREPPYNGRRRKIVVQWINATVQSWVTELERHPGGSAAAGKGGDTSAIGADVTELLGNCIELLGQMTSSGAANGEMEEITAIRRESSQLSADVERIVHNVSMGSVFMR